jgi:hypothetical protein
MEMLLRDSCMGKKAPGVRGHGDLTAENSWAEPQKKLEVYPERPVPPNK